MQNIKLSARFKILAQQIANLNRPFETIADIGTDHGYLPLILFKDNLIQKGILCDINQGPLDNAKQTFSGTPYSQNVTFRLGSGIEPLSMGEVDLVIIAGMGGALIKEILSRDLIKTKSMKYYLLQPMTEQDMLREWLISNGFVYLWDQFAEVQGKHYEIIMVSTLESSNHLDYSCYDMPNDDLEFGLRILESQTDAALNFMTHKMQKYQVILDGLSNSNKDSLHEKRDLCHKKMDKIDEIISILKVR